VEEAMEMQRCQPYGQARNIGCMAAMAKQGSRQENELVVIVIRVAMATMAKKEGNKRRSLLLLLLDLRRCGDKKRSLLLLLSELRRPRWQKWKEGACYCCHQTSNGGHWQ